MSKILHMNRRDAIQWVASAATLLGSGALGACRNGYTKGAAALGYGRDPDLVDPKRQTWPQLLTDGQRAVLADMIDVILPTTKTHKAASQVGVLSFFEEWLSAPYPQFESDRAVIMPFINRFPNPGAMAQRLRGLTHEPGFERLRLLTAAAYYTTPFGIEAIGFIGNEPRASFDGPPQAVRDHFAKEFNRLA